MAVDWNKLRDHNVYYNIIVYDNYHYQDSEEAYMILGFETAEDAIKKCREIVEQSITECSNKHTTSDSIYCCYTMFGEDPAICSPAGAEQITFSGWTYARECADRAVT